MKTDWQVMKRLLQILSPMKWIMLFSASMRITKMVGDTALIAVAAGTVFYYVAEPSSAVLWQGAMWLVITAAIVGTSHYLEQFSGHYVAFVLLAKLRNMFYDSMEPLAPAKTAKLQTGDAIGRVMSDCDRIEPFYAHTLAPVVGVVFVPIILMSFLWTIHPSLALTMGPFLVIITVVGPVVLTKLGQGGDRQWREMQGKVNAYLTDSIQGIRDTVAFGYGDRRAREVASLGEKLQEGQERLFKADALQRGFNEIIITIAIIATAWVAISLANQGLIDPLRDIPIVLAIAVTGFTTGLEFCNAYNDFRVSVVCARRFFEMMDQQPDVVNLVETGPGDVEPSVHFNHVNFEYDAEDAAWSRDEQILKDLDLEIGAGKHFALVGPTGAGKSTIINLLMRYWDPQGGKVCIGDAKLQDFLLSELQDKLSTVSQRSYIFNSNIGENIRMGKPEASQEEIEKAAAQANLLDWIKGLPDGFDTEVGERGSKLSGGQRQRIAIARAMLKDAPIVLLDEATSNLDVETEKDVLTAVKRLCRGRTTLTIAHRLSTVVDADEILVMDSGHIAEHGTHQELMDKQGWYAKMFEMQLDEVDALEPGIA
jgi:ATP-binding cassette subfamily C protein CydC